MTLDQISGYKSAAYDRVVAINRLQGELNQLNQAIAEETKKLQEAEAKKVKKEDKVEKKEEKK